MKNIKSFLLILFILLISFLGIRTYINFSISRGAENINTNLLKEAANLLNECFDLENKSNRSINDSMNLIDYCLKEYGSKN